MIEKKFEFGKNYIVFDYKIKKLQEGSASKAELSVADDSFDITLSLYNADNVKINETSVMLPLDTLIESASLDYENKKIILNTVNSEPIDCDISELIDSITSLDNLKADRTELTSGLSGKVDKVAGKGLSTNDFTTAEKTKLSDIEDGAQVNEVTSVAGKKGIVTLVKADVGLGNVDNTKDTDKPISTAAQSALSGKVDKTTKVNSKPLSSDIELTGADIIDTYTAKPVSQAIEDLSLELYDFFYRSSGYVLATDNDFIVKNASNSYFGYIGTDEYIVVPKMIQGYQVTNLRSYSSDSMFRDVSNVKGVVTANKLSDFGFAFSDCKSTSLDLRYLNTSKVTNMGGMFSYCNKLTTLDLSNFDTSNVTGMASMFEECTKLTTLDLSHFDTSNVTSMAYMFYYCTNLTTLDLSHFDTSKVTSMRSMFHNCFKLTTLDLSNFGTSTMFTADMFTGVKNCTVYFKGQDEIDFFTANPSWDASNTAVIKGV